MDNVSTPLQPLVSIVIPNFNQGELLQQALQSVTSQTYSNWEVIVVDNFSTDDSEAICSSFSHAEKLKFIQRANFGVIARSRNIGIQSSKGQLVAFLDSDDLWDPNKLELAVQAFYSGADLSYHRMRSMSPDVRRAACSEKVLRSRQVRPPITRDLLLWGNALLNSSVVVTKALLEAVGPLDEAPDMIGAEDYNLWLRISIETNSFHRIPGILGNYRIHNSSVSRSQGFTKSRQAAAVKSFLVSSEQKPEVDPGLRSLLSARESLASNDFKKALLHLFQALKKGDFEVKVRSIANLVKIVFYKPS